MSRQRTWTRDRRWLKKMLVEAGDAAYWSSEKTAKVEARLKKIMLETMAADPKDIAAIEFGMEAVGVVVAVEGAKQEAELAALEAERRRSMVVIINL